MPAPRPRSCRSCVAAPRAAPARARRQPGRPTPTIRTPATPDASFRLSALRPSSTRCRELLHPLLLPLVELLGRQIFLVRRDRPAVALWIDEGSAAIAPELVLHLTHRAAGDLRARRPGAIEEGVAVLDVDPQRCG